jgi:hypothetical protein
MLGLIDNPFSMVVAIIAIITIGKVLRAKFRAQHGIVEDDRGAPQRLMQDPDSDRMRDEIKVLKDRIQVLERIATDNNSANDLNRQIEELRNR